MLCLGLLHYSSTSSYSTELLLLGCFSASHCSLPATRKGPDLRPWERVWKLEGGLAAALLIAADRCCCLAISSAAVSRRETAKLSASSAGRLCRRLILVSAASLIMFSPRSWNLSSSIPALGRVARYSIVCSLWSFSWAQRRCIFQLWTNWWSVK